MAALREINGSASAAPATWPSCSRVPFSQMPVPEPEVRSSYVGPAGRHGVGWGGPGRRVGDWRRCRLENQLRERGRRTSRSSRSSNPTSSRHPGSRSSRDGRHLAFTVDRDEGSVLAIRSIDQFSPVALPGTAGAMCPFFFAGRPLARLLHPDRAA